MLTPTLIADVYGVRADVRHDRDGGRISVSFQPGAPISAASRRSAAMSLAGRPSLPLGSHSAGIGATAPVCSTDRS
ncbi:MULTISPECIES: hypothetical protein [Nocardioides]|uniref:Uncharacterized protein n=1 Tax=Nocardioides vastitatis TaxID=2568655 RepID=A0ABW0ZMJ2_9ACTN|nr:hypothetical protein [Nocardioides sp.]